jgi:hypothetical protein
VTQVGEQGRRTLEQERRAGRLRVGRVIGPRRLEQDRDVRPRHADAAREVEPGLDRQLAVGGELDVRDHAEDVLLERGERVPRILVRAAQDDLGTRPHPHDLVRDVHALGHQPTRVVEQLGVDRRQERRVVPDVVLDQDDDLDPHRLGVVDDVAAIFDVLDDREQDPRVALPDEGSLDRREIVVAGELADVAGVEREQDHRDVAAQLLDPARQLGAVHVGEVEPADDQVEPTAGLAQHLERLGTRRHRGQAGSVVQVEVAKLADDALADLAGFLEHERVVRARDEQDVHDAVPHQVVEILEPAAGRHRGT